MRLLLLIRSLAPAQGQEAHPWLQATFRGRSTVVILVALLGLLLSVADTQPPFTIARLQYSGGGDWYSDPSSLPNLLRFLNQHTRINAAEEQAQSAALAEELYAAELQQVREESARGAGALFSAGFSATL